MLPALDDVGHALTAEEEAALLLACQKSRSRSLYPAVMLALNTGMRYSEIRLLQWRQVDFSAKFLTVGKSKTQAGAGRAIPLNTRILSTLDMWKTQFPNREPHHYVFPFERCGAKGESDSYGFTAQVVFYGTDTTRPIGDWKEAWEKAKERAAVILKGKPDTPQLAKFRGDKDTSKLGQKPDCIKGGRKPESLRCRFHDFVTPPLPAS
jgi:integrase